MEELKCEKCGEHKIREVMDGGIKMTIHWEDGYVIREETEFVKNSKHSTFYCDNPGCSNYKQPI